MARGNEFEIILGATGEQEVKKTLTELEKDLKDFQKQLSSTKEVKVIADLNNKLEQTRNSINAIKKVGSNGLGGIAPGANNATQSMTNLARIVQDMPYGFMAVANNLDPFLESLSRTSREAGGTGKALKLLGQQLLGAGGLAIGLSVVSSLVVKAQQEYGSLANALDHVFGSLSNVQKANIALNKTLAESGAGAAGELATLRALVSIAQDETRSRQSRLQAIQKLNKEYDNYLPNLDIENIKTQEVTAAIDKLSNSLVRQAKIKGVQDLISKESAAQVEAITKGLSENTTWYEDLFATVASGGDIMGAFTKKLEMGAKNLSQTLSTSARRAEIYKKTLQELLGSEAAAGTLFTDPAKAIKTKKLAKTFDQLFAAIDKSAGQGWQKLIEQSEKWRDQYYDEWAKQISAADKRQKIIDAFNRTNEAIQKGIVGIQAGGSLDPFGGGQLSAIDQIGQIQARLQAFGQTPRNTDWLTDEGAKLLLLTDQWDAYSKKLQAVGPLVQEFLAPAFGQFFDSVLSGTQTAGQALQSFFQNLIRQIISTVAQAAALAAIMSAITGGGFGALFKGFLGGGKMPNFGAVGGAKDAFGGISITGTLRGRDIALAGQFGAASNSRIGYG